MKDVRWLEALSRLPFEEKVSQALDRVSAAIEANPVAQRLDQLAEEGPSLPSVSLPTPLGTVDLVRPIPLLPRVSPPRLDARRKEALKAALGVDLVSLIGLVPVVGDYVAEELGDVYMHRLRSVLTPEELARFERLDKGNPFDVLAMWRALQHGRRR